MRIISGKYKGKKLVAPKKLPVRPTTDMAKEGLFNILNNRYNFEDLKVLDLFSGTGNISYEFASRGALDILAVDSNAKCVQFISKTAEELGFGITTVKSDVNRFLKSCDRKFDFIFADPPYNFDQGLFIIITELVFTNQLLSEKGLLVIEHSSRMDLSSGKNYSEGRKYGGSVFSFFAP